MNEFMVTSLNATPRPIYPGFQDLSGVRLPYEPEQLPQNLPLFYCQTERGRLAPSLTSGEHAKSNYGTKSFQERSNFYSHQTLGAMNTNAEGNMFFLKRVVAEDAKRASAVLCLEVVKDEIPQYSRLPNGDVERDINNDKIIDTSVPAVLGYRLALSIREVADINNLRGEAIRQGSLTGSAGEPSQVYPITAGYLEYGAFGNNVGFRMWQANANTSEPTDPDLVETEQAMPYRWQWMERTTGLSLPVVTPAKNGSMFIDFCFKENVIDPKVDLALPIDNIKNAWEFKRPGYVPSYGPLENFYVYQDNIETVMAMLGQAEMAVNPDVTGAHQVNFISALDISGNDHYAIAMDSSSLVFTENNTHYYVGGSDGTVSEEKLDELVREECLNNWANIEYPLVDIAKYPLSNLYDTGFTIDTKKAMLDVIGYRPDIFTACCTQDILELPNSITQESAMATSLRNYARMVPESTIYGTPCCRAVLIGQVGELLDSNYKRAKAVPLIHEYIIKRAKYMGAGTGKMIANEAYDVEDAKRLTAISEPTHPWKPLSTYIADWDIGLNWAKNYDRVSTFFPALQTVYDDDTSVLNSEINMSICCDILRRADMVWRQMTGNSKYTPAYFAQRCDELMYKYTEGRYDSRAELVVKTYYTALDEMKGYAWTTTIGVRLNVMKTVMTVNLQTYRRTDENFELQLAA